MEGCRLATRDDLPRIVELARAMREEIRSVRGGDVWALREGRPEPLEASYGALFDDAGVRVLVGTIDGTVMGFAVGETDVLHDGGLLGIISDICVEPGARAIGVGEEMANNLVDHFRALGCIGVDSWALPGQRETKNFFEEHGFVSRGIVVHKRLTDDAPEASPSE
ncbi:MAG TPA: GNAT family N-acetyltransferase [Acidimicrobiia bacterium]|nr:GNAT family N-acetyltransferase [Acidimicrobiia bacterium]